MLLLFNSEFSMNSLKLTNFSPKIQNAIRLAEVELGVNYVLIISTNAGLWSYNIGDTIQFTSLKPYRVIVSEESNIIFLLW